MGGGGIPLGGGGIGGGGGDAPPFIEVYCERVLTGHTGAVTDATFLPTASLLVTCSLDCTIRFWDVRSALCVRKLGHSLGEVTAVQLSRYSLRSQLHGIRCSIHMPTAIAFTAAHALVCHSHARKAITPTHTQTRASVS